MASNGAVHRLADRLVTDGGTKSHSPGVARRAAAAHAAY
jgi:hypothetical protein